MDHRAISIKFLTTTGLIPVKVRPKQKDPFPEWDPRRVASEDHGVTIRELQANVDLNLGALFYGKYVDIDDDSSNPMLRRALDWFLPRTPYVWGRTSKPRGHRVYALHDDFDRNDWSGILRFIKNLRGPDKEKKETHGAVDEFSYSVEIRGGKPENGLFSVLPGSINPSGEIVEWDEKIDPTVGGAFIEVNKLVRAVRLAVVSAILANCWHEGLRNDISLALAGTLWRIRAATMAAFGLEPDEEAPPGCYILDKDDAEAIFRCVMELAGDDENDKRSRLLNLNNTWRKLDGEASSKVTGGKVLASLVGEDKGLRVVKALYRLLSDSDAAETLEAMAERYVMWYGPGVIIDLHMIRDSRDSPWMTRHQAEASLGGKNISIAGKKIPVSKMLFGSSIIDRIVGLTFDPSTTDTILKSEYGLKVNQWRGFAKIPCPQQVSYEEVKFFVDYVREVLACDDPDSAHWIFAWLSDMLRFPHAKPGTSLVLVGVEGAGKTFLAEHIISKIIGSVHSTQTNSVSTLTHNFNTIVDNKVFICCNEAIHSYQRDIAARLKSIITDETIVIEPKGINSYTKPNHMRLMFTSNEENAAIFISPSPYERRFTVLRVSSKRARDREYWENMHAWTPGALEKIMRWLLDYRYERWVVMRPIDTEAKRNIQKVGLDTEVAWILNRIAAGFPLDKRNHQYCFEAYNNEIVEDKDFKDNNLRRDAWPNIVQMSSVEADYTSFVRSMGKPVHSGSVITTIRKVFPENTLGQVGQKTVQYRDLKTGQLVKTRVRQYNFPMVEQILNHLRNRYGNVVDEMMDSMDVGEIPTSNMDSGSRGEL